MNKQARAIEAILETRMPNTNGTWTISARAMALVLKADDELNTMSRSMTLDEAATIEEAKRAARAPR